MGLVNAVCAIKNGYHANLGNGENSGYACIASKRKLRKNEDIHHIRPSLVSFQYYKVL